MGCILYRQSNEKSTALLCISAAICSFRSCPAKPARLVPAGIFAYFNSGSALRFAPSTNRYGGSADRPRGRHIQHSIQYQSPQAGRGVALGFQAVIQIIYRFCFAGCGIQAVFQPFARARKVLSCFGVLVRSKVSTAVLNFSGSAS